MAFNSKKVEQMVRGKGIKAREFFTIVYPDRSGNASFTDIAKNNNPKADTIERIADLLRCPIDDLFERDQDYSSGNHVNGDNNNVGNFHINSDPEVLQATISHLRDVITRQDKTILELNHRIDQLIELAKK